MNFNRGHLPLDYTMTSKVAEGSVQALLGRVMLKGNSRELLPAGTYRVYAMLGDTLGGSFRHVPKGARLHSNPLTITIR